MSAFWLLICDFKSKAAMRVFVFLNGTVIYLSFTSARYYFTSPTFILTMTAYSECYQTPMKCIGKDCFSLTCITCSSTINS